MKKSKRGRLALTCENGVFETVPAENVDLDQNLLKVVYQNGRISNTQSFAEIRERAGESLLGVV
jgi:nicotinamide phosphoribosyltransferase